MIQVTDVHGQMVLVQPFMVMVVATFRGDSKPFPHKPNAVITFQTGGSICITETVEAYRDMERLGLDKPL